jgi:iron complex transport system ATP-binding protein
MSIAVAGVSVRYGPRSVLSEATIEARAGEVLGLLGPNGAGKSTLLSVMSGERRPSSGTVMVDGRPLRSWRAAALARRRAVMPQASSLAFDFTVREVVELGRLPHAGLLDVVRDRIVVDQAMDLLDVAHLAARPYPRLSGGEQQRVQAARVLAQVWEPPSDATARFLLLDEPTASLDLQHQHALLRTVRNFAGALAGAVVVLHDINLAALYCDRVAVMAKGRIVACGATATTLGEALLSEVYSVDVIRIQRPGSERPAFLVDPGPAADGTALA